MMFNPSAARMATGFFFHSLILNLSDQFRNFLTANLHHYFNHVNPFSILKMRFSPSKKLKLKLAKDEEAQELR